MKKNESVIIFCAHNDDQIIGAGGTIAKYVSLGKAVYVFIFSYGENSHPHYKPKVIIKQRVEESKKSDKILGITETRYLGLKEGKFLKTKGIRKKIASIIESIKPTKIFTHSLDDVHPDHRAVQNLVLAVNDARKKPAELYTFEVWNLFTFRQRNSPKLIVDITDTFARKVKAFKAHESQKTTLWTLLWNVYLKAMLNGFNHGYRYAEVFYRIR